MAAWINDEFVHACGHQWVTYRHFWTAVKFLKGMGTYVSRLQFLFSQNHFTSIAVILHRSIMNLTTHVAISRWLCAFFWMMSKILSLCDNVFTVPQLQPFHKHDIDLTQINCKFVNAHGRTLALFECCEMYSAHVKICFSQNVLTELKQFRRWGSQCARIDYEFVNAFEHHWVFVGFFWILWNVLSPCSNVFFWPTVLPQLKPFHRHGGHIMWISAEFSWACEHQSVLMGHF